MPEFKRAVNVIPLTRVALKSAQIFTYLVPLKFQGQMRPGQLVKVPFGPRQIFGVVCSFEIHRLETETKGYKILTELADATPVLSEQNLNLANWLAQYYVTSLGSAVKAMLPARSKKVRSSGLVGYEKYNPDFVLTEAQHQAVAQISASLGQTGVFLLHGVTGSGKTEVYMQLFERVLEGGSQVLMLVPEISLTDPAVERFARRFGIDSIALLHSKLGQAERFWTWQKIRSGEKKIIIGPRSAMFAPVRSLGLIVLDEEHDQSFKQYDQNPKYHARTVAERLSELWHCPLVLGDATPSVETYQRAVEGKIKLLVLPHRIKADLGMPKVHVVDMREERRGENYSIFSEFLKLQILDNLKAGRQIILFLNRRGTANLVMCRDCGYIPLCQYCSVNLVWHETAAKLICHHCGRSYPLPDACPSCGSHRIGIFGLGTQRVETELKKFLMSDFGGKTRPIIARMDSDVTAGVGAGSNIYHEWAAGKIQILIGTQMITKGWDIGRVGLVGVVSADTILSLPDFRSNERTFQVLTQVAGRTGRGGQSGLVILQTYHPENYAIEAAKTHDYEKFYKAEIRERERFLYPPFVRLVKLTVKNKQADKAAKEADDLHKRLSLQASTSVEILGPLPAFIAKLRGQYQFRIILRVTNEPSSDLYQFLRNLPGAVDIDVDPEELL
jgi:primosomal protein N' (replication factor Y)